MTLRPTGPVGMARALAWWGIAPIAVLAAVLVVVLGAWRGQEAAAGALLGGVVCVVAFSITALLHPLLESTHPRHALALAMGLYTLKAAALAAFVSLPELRRACDPLWFAVVLVGGILWWTGMVLTTHVRARIVAFRADWPSDDDPM